MKKNFLNLQTIILSYLTFLAGWTVWVCCNHLISINEYVDWGIGVIVYFIWWPLFAIFFVKRYNKDLMISFKEMTHTKPKIKILLPLLAFAIAYNIGVYFFHSSGFGSRMKIYDLIITVLTVGIFEESLFRGWFLNAIAHFTSERKERISPIKIHKDIEKTADDGFNFRRNEEGLSKALEEILKIQNYDINEMSTKSKNRNYNYEWIEAIQVKNLLICTEAGIRAALMRKESRGTHIRKDYKFVDNDNWLVRIMSSRGEDGLMNLSVRNPKVTKIKLPTGKNKDIPDYILTI